MLNYEREPRMENYVVLSDLHLGEKSDECTFADSNNVKAFAEELGRLGEIKELVLLGDFLELSLAPMSMVTEQMKDFFEGIAVSHEKIEKIVYVPGNHDHHIWSLHVEQEIIDGMKAGKAFNCPDYIDKEFVGVNSFLSGYLPAGGFKEKLVVKYPVHEIRLSNGKKCLLHHGHQIYGVGVRLLSLKEAQKIPEDRQMRELELQNIGVYELLWFYLELSGDLKRRIELEWKENGGFGAFGVVAEEMADSWVADTLMDLGRFFTGPNDRGRTIAKNRKDMRQYLKIYGKAVDYLVYGHSHVPELVRGSELRNDFPVEIIGNCGSWVRERGEHNTYIVINERGVHLKKLGETDAIKHIG
jgi:UDP-2,3-diacylglucosamine pyrophosphatase LpxH